MVEDTKIEKSKKILYMKLFEDLLGYDFDQVYSLFTEEFLKDDFLLNHRNYIDKNGLGFGENPFHTLWREIVRNQKDNFKFLEIGVYKGQVLSLIKLLSKRYDKPCSILGVSPLASIGDKYSQYESVNYKQIIHDLFIHFGTEIIFEDEFLEGYSTHENIKSQIRSRGPFDVVYIDGCHDYNCVVSDISLAKDITTNGSLIVVDDASCFKTSHRHYHHKGHLEVCLAVKEFMENSEYFTELISVGHNRVFQRN